MWVHLLERPLYSRALGGQPPQRNFFPAKNHSCAFACGGRGLDAALTSMAGRERERERERETALCMFSGLLMLPLSAVIARLS